MRAFDWVVVIVMGGVGWLVVSFLLNRGGTQRQEDDRAARPDESADAEFPTMPRLPSSAMPSSQSSSDLLSLEEIGRSWHSILGVSADASGAQIESAYHAKLARCDERERGRVIQAYEFIRPSRS